MGEDFIFDFDSYLDELWNRENPKGKAGLKKGGYYDGKYHPYLTDNGDWDIGPGFDLSKQNEDFVKKAYSTGFTKDELNNIVRTRAYSASKDIINKYKEIGGDPKNLTQKVHNGMLDMYWELGKNGLINGYKNFWEAAKNVDYAGMQKESRTTFWDKNQKKQRPNISRWNFRKSEYFQDPDALKYIERPNPYSVRPIQETSQPEYNGIIQDNPIPYRPTIGRFSDTMKAHGGPLSDQQYYSIMERVAEENNPIWNQHRVKEGGRPLSVDEEYLRILNDNSYNYRGFYEENPEAAANASTHWPDRYKTVWHPTFSTESIYSGKKSQYNPEGVLGGQWNGDEYVPAWGQRLPKYSDGGPINTPKSWNDLSLTEKAEMMKVAIQNGITTLPEIRQKYNEFARGGYIPSEEAKQRISKWEGKAMTGAVDPLSGKFAKNNSFESEARGFYNALPEDIREQVLSNQELADSLYSYSYNVGAGNFKRRVVPALQRYYAGNGSIEDIQESMWASGDKKLRGLQRRRAEERQGVKNALLRNIPAFSSVQDSTPLFDYVPMNPQVFESPLATYEPTVMSQEPEQPIVKAAMEEAYSPEQIERAERQDRLNKFGMLLSMMNPGQQNSLTGTIGMLTGNAFAEGGNIYDDGGRLVN